MKNLVIFFILVFGLQFQAQELDCKVVVNQTSNTTSINPQVFKTLERSISEFMNNRKWTDETYTPTQKIKCNITINILDATSKENSYKADFIIQSERPVFNTTYYTPLLRHSDKSIPFDYIENQPFDFSEQNFFNNLTSILGFYAHFIIGMNKETFANKGGQAEFEKCQIIANNVPANHTVSGELATGWQASEAQDIKGQRTRIGVLLTYLSSSSDAYRNAVYKYHLQGLDMLEDNAEKAINTIETALNEIAEANNGHYVFKHFVGAKVEEIMNVFKEVATVRREKIKELLLKIEPVVSDRIPK